MMVMTRARESLAAVARLQALVGQAAQGTRRLQVGHEYMDECWDGASLAEGLASRAPFVPPMVALLEAR